MMKYTITTADGVFENLTMNGTMYVSQEEVHMEDLNLDALCEVTITAIDEDGTETEVTYENMVCDGVLRWPEGWMFNLREMTREEQNYAEMDARLAFLEMMGGYDE